jgi:hypothetical protein
MKPFIPVTIYIPITSNSLMVKKGQRISTVFFFLCLIFIFFVPSAMPTTIIAFRTSNELILAADSLSNRVISGPNSLVCKITQIKNVFVTFSGRISAEGAINFSMIDIARDVFSRAGAIQEKVALFNTIIKSNLELLVNDDRKNKEWFKKLYNTKDRVISVVIIAVVTDSNPTFYAYQYVVASSAEQSARIIEMPVKSILPIKLGDYDVVLGGEYNAFKKDLPESPLPKSFNAIKNIRRWITKEANIVPDKVGLPVDILRITPSRAEWIQHKKECQEINEDDLKNSLE